MIPDPGKSQIDLDRLDPETRAKVEAALRQDVPESFGLLAETVGEPSWYRARSGCRLGDDCVIWLQGEWRNGTVERLSKTGAIIRMNDELYYARPYDLVPPSNMSSVELRSLGLGGADDAEAAQDPAKA